MPPGRICSASSRLKSRRPRSRQRASGPFEARADDRQRRRGIFEKMISPAGGAEAARRASRSLNADALPQGLLQPGIVAGCIGVPPKNQPHQFISRSDVDSAQPTWPRPIACRPIQSSTIARPRAN